MRRYESENILTQKADGNTLACHPSVEGKPRSGNKEGDDTGDVFACTLEDPIRMTWVVGIHPWLMITKYC